VRRMADVHFIVSSLRYCVAAYLPRAGTDGKQ
jgi:hypothetical protein